MEKKNDQKEIQKKVTVFIRFVSLENRGFFGRSISLVECLSFVLVRF